MLSLDQINAITDPRPVRREAVPQWNGDVFLRALNGRELSRYEAWSASIAKRDDFTAIWSAGVVILHLCDEQGNRLFQLDGNEPLTTMADDWADRQNSGVLARLFFVCEELSVLTERARAKKNAASSAAATCDSGTSSSGSSDSPCEDSKAPYPQPTFPT